MDRQEANTLISEQIKIAREAITAAERIADEAGISFRIALGGYGMGGMYISEGMYRKERDIPEGEVVGQEDDYGEVRYGWLASSQSC